MKRAGTRNICVCFFFFFFFTWPNFAFILLYLHMILVSTRNFVTARPHNNIFRAVAMSSREKQKRSSCPFVPKRAVKEKLKGNCFFPSFVSLAFLTLFWPLIIRITSQRNENSGNWDETLPILQ